ncbi:MAG TPA: hypothetical protein VK540_14295 [Polyangiaceae bacterium]|nr:hypothetical protein [Polyangiaceae bacterium]
MSKIDPILTKMRAICLSLPDTKETLTWGQPHFRVGDKIFSGYGEEKGPHRPRADEESVNTLSPPRRSAASGSTKRARKSR